MTVKELITKLLECPMDASVIVQKELSYNCWVNSKVYISETDRDTVTLSFDFEIPDRLKKLNIGG